MISPGYPREMAFFTRGLAATVSTVIVIGDQSTSNLPDIARDALTHYITSAHSPTRLPFWVRWPASRDRC
jgi:hypothetical protein